MDNQNQILIQNETEEEKEQRIRAEVDKLTEGKSIEELIMMAANALAKNQMELVDQWTNAMRKQCAGGAVTFV